MQPPQTMMCSTSSKKSLLVDRVVTALVADPTADPTSTTLTSDEDLSELSELSEDESSDIELTDIEKEPSTEHTADPTAKPTDVKYSTLTNSSVWSRLIKKPLKTGFTKSNKL